VDRKYAVGRGRLWRGTKGSMSEKRSDRLRERERLTFGWWVDGTFGAGRCVWDGGEEREY